VSLAAVCRRLGKVDRRASALAFALALAALFVRLDGLGERSFGHPENYIAGVPMPEWVHPNARRTDLGGVVEGMRTDGHPPLYFAFMLAWTGLFGHGLVALRLPSALLGAASVALVYRLALRAGDRRTALLAGALVALSGLHVYWSQLARMYVPTSFLVLASTLLLVRLREAPRPALAWGYGLTTAAALWTQLYAWPAIAAQALWIAWRGLRRRAVPAAVPALACALIAAVPVVAQLLHRTATVNEFQQSPWGYFALGHAFSTRLPFWGAAPAAPVPATWLAAGTLALLLLALARPSQPAMEAGREVEFLAARPGRVIFAGLAALALASMFAVWRFVSWAAMAGPVRPAVVACALLPLGLAAVTGVLLVRTAAPRRLTATGTDAADDARGLVAVLAVAPLLLMVAVSRFHGALVDRGTVVFLPYLLLLVAVGARACGRRPWLPAVVSVALLAVSVASLAHYRRAQATPRDYAGLARELAHHLAPEDLVLLDSSYRDPPLLYYFGDAHHQFALRRRWRQLAAPSPSRLWIVAWDRDALAEPPGGTVPGFRPTATVLRAHHAAAALHLRRARTVEGR
jgi:4-amino-4-deoxy-L-arabinose transferase-like glycosyltransferase